MKALIKVTSLFISFVLCLISMLGMMNGLMQGNYELFGYSALLMVVFFLLFAVLLFTFLAKN